jgi:flagellar hook-basal body complex protein FliE
MSIQNYAGLKSILNKTNVNDWKSSVEFGKKIDLKGLKLEQGLDQVEKGEKTFGEYLTDQFVKVNSLQQDANVAMEKLASGESNNLQETLLAVEKADLAFKTMNQVRMKVIDAYREIMKTQI